MLVLNKDALFHFMLGQCAQVELKYPTFTSRVGPGLSVIKHYKAVIYKCS